MQAYADPHNDGFSAFDLKLEEAFSSEGVSCHSNNKLPNAL
jgi:hypothetical protein